MLEGQTFEPHTPPLTIVIEVALIEGHLVKEQDRVALHEQAPVHLQIPFWKPGMWWVLWYA